MMTNAAGVPKRGREKAADGNIGWTGNRSFFTGVCRRQGRRQRTQQARRYKTMTSVWESKIARDLGVRQEKERESPRHLPVLLYRVSETVTPPPWNSQKLFSFSAYLASSCFLSKPGLARISSSSPSGTSEPTAKRGFSEQPIRQHINSYSRQSRSAACPSA